MADRELEQFAACFDLDAARFTPVQSDEPIRTEALELRLTGRDRRLLEELHRDVDPDP